MSKIETKGLKSQDKLFHNELISVYPTQLQLDAITFWPKNNRTLFTFERLERNLNKSIDELSVKQITEFVADQDIHKLDVLAKSIGRNGVQVPLIIRDDGKLLDGNRRFFACQLLRRQYEEKGLDEPSSLANIPAFVIREEDLTEELELKIIAEANFIPDLKVSWPLDAQARAVDEYYRRSLKRGLDEDAAILESAGIFGISRGRVIDFIDTLSFTEKFINLDNSEEGRIKRHIIAEERFVYFWEFVNKATKGRGKIIDEADLSDVMAMFFKLIGEGRESVIRNVKQVEPLIQAKKEAIAWNMLKESNGQSLSTVVSMINEKREIRRSEDRIRQFLSWLTAENHFPQNVKSLLQEVIEMATWKVGK